MGTPEFPDLGKHFFVDDCKQIDFLPFTCDRCTQEHVNADCDPSSYEKTVEKKKKKCPVPRCRELLTFSNSIKWRDCSVEHCLNHRFGPYHGCAGPKKPESRWSSLLASSISRLGTDISQKLQFSSGGDVEGNVKQSCGKVTVDVCPKCSRGFRDPVDLLEHIDKDHHGTSNA